MSNYKTIESDQLVDIFKALANSHRLKIYDILTNCCTPGSSCATNEVGTTTTGESEATSCCGEERGGTQGTTAEQAATATTASS